MFSVWCCLIWRQMFLWGTWMGSEICLSCCISVLVSQQWLAARNSVAVSFNRTGKAPTADFHTWFGAPFSWSGCFNLVLRSFSTSLLWHLRQLVCHPALFNVWNFEYIIWMTRVLYERLAYLFCFCVPTSTGIGGGVLKLRHLRTKNIKSTSSCFVHFCPVQFWPFPGGTPPVR